MLNHNTLPRQLIRVHGFAYNSDTLRRGVRFQVFRCDLNSSHKIDINNKALLMILMTFVKIWSFTLCGSA